VKDGADQVVDAWFALVSWSGADARSGAGI